MWLLEIYRFFLVFNHCCCCCCCCCSLVVSNKRQTNHWTIANERRREKDEDRNCRNRIVFSAWMSRWFYMILIACLSLILTLFPIYINTSKQTSWKVSMKNKYFWYDWVSIRQCRKIIRTYVVKLRYCGQRRKQDHR